MVDYNIFKKRYAKWEARVVAEECVIYQCSECGNVDDPQKKECSCCRAVMEVDNA